MKSILFATGLLVGNFSALAESFSYSSYGGLPGTTMPVIIQNPLAQIVPLGSSPELTVVATGDYLLYQWELNGDIIPGATNAILTITDIGVDSSGTYRVYVFNGAGYAKSPRAYLGIAAQTLPFSDTFASRGSVSNALGRGIGNSQGATKQAGEPTPCSPRVGKSLWLTWVAPTNGIALFKTAGSGFDSVLAAYTGNTVSTLVEVAAADDDTADAHNSYVAFNAQAGSAYQIYVGSLDLDGGPIILSWSMLPSTWPWPTSVVPPTNVTTLPGSATTMTVRFQSATPLTVQWYQNGVLIPGATNQTTVASTNIATLQWSQLTEANLGIYQVSLSSPNWTWFLKPAEIQFNSAGISTAGARNKLVNALP